MPRTAEELLAEALELPDEARAQLVRLLLASLDTGDEVDTSRLEREWLEEATRRAEEIDAGAVKTRPAAEVFRAARDELRVLRERRVSGA